VTWVSAFSALARPWRTQAVNSQIYLSKLLI